MLYTLQLNAHFCLQWSKLAIELVTLFYPVTKYLAKGTYRKVSGDSDFEGTATSWQSRNSDKSMWQVTYRYREMYPSMTTFSHHHLVWGPRQLNDAIYVCRSLPSSVNPFWKQEVRDVLSQWVQVQSNQQQWRFTITPPPLQTWHSNTPL